MIKKKIKSKAKTKVKAKKVSKKVTAKVKNPVYLDSDYKLKEIYFKYIDILYLKNDFVNIHSNIGILYGILTINKSSQGLSYNTIVSSGIEAGLDYLNRRIFTLKTDFNQIPDRDDLSLIAENDDYLGNELFWNEHDEFKKYSFKKSNNFQFTLENVDKVDIINHRIYVRRLKQVKSKND